MSRTVGSPNVLPSAKERARLLAVLKRQAADGDTLAILGLLLASSPYSRHKEPHHATHPK